MYNRTQVLDGVQTLDAFSGTNSGSNREKPEIPAKIGFRHPGRNFLVAFPGMHTYVTSPYCRVPALAYC